MNIKNIKREIKKLQSKIAKLEKERTKNRKNAEYHHRKIESSKTAKAYEKHVLKENFYRREMDKLRTQIVLRENKIRDLEAQIQQIEYKKKLKAFDDGMANRLQDLATGLDIFVHELNLCDLYTIYQEIYDYYTEHSLGLEKEDLRPYSNLNFQSVKIRLSNIADKYNEARVRQGTRGDAVFRGIVKHKPITWAKHLSSQIKDTIYTVKKRSGLLTNAEIREYEKNA